MFIRIPAHALRNPTRPCAPILLPRYEALKHVSFAVQTLGKCAKMFPVMLWGFFILRKKYGWRDVGLAVAITSGCFAFFSFGPTASRCAWLQHHDASPLWMLMLLAASTTCGVCVCVCASLTTCMLLHCRPQIQSKPDTRNACKDTVHGFLRNCGQQ